MANKIYPFCPTDTTTNLLTDAEYLADAQRSTGNQPGKARSKLVNKALRQTSTVAAGIAELIATLTGSDVTDGLTPSAFAGLLTQAIFDLAAPVGSMTQLLGTSAPDGNYLPAQGGLYLRSDYPRLWAYIQGSGNLVTDAVWLAGRFGAYSSGNGSTNFRLPDLRAMFFRELDAGRGIDVGRQMGTYQADDNKAHTHPTTGSEQAQASTGISLTVPYVSGTPLTDYIALQGSEARPKNIPVTTWIKY